MIQLFCVTYAGGSAKFFQEFIRLMPREIECICIEYAGHGNRQQENRYVDFGEMVEDVAAQINMCIDMQKKVALFGYSMGSLVAYEVVSRNLLKKMPCHIFVAAHYAPSVCSVKEKVSELSDEDLVKKMELFGGMPPILAANRRFWPLYLPVIRSDYHLLEIYDFNSQKVQIDVDLTVFYSEQDTPFKYIKDWEKVISNEKCVKFYEMYGKHFFLKQCKQEIALIISKCLI